MNCFPWKKKNTSMATDTSTDSSNPKVHYHVGDNQQGTSHKVYVEEGNRLAVDSSIGKKVFTCCCLCCKCEFGQSLEVASSTVGREPIFLTCSNCGNVVYTDRSYLTTKYTHILACALSPICCCLLPYFFNWWKYVRHNCPICKRYIGFSK